MVALAALRCHYQHQLQLEILMGVNRESRASSSLKDFVDNFNFTSYFTISSHKLKKLNGQNDVYGSKLYF